jgi:hypothetical protein
MSVTEINPIQQILKKAQEKSSQTSTLVIGLMDVDGRIEVNAFSRANGVAPIALVQKMIDIYLTESFKNDFGRKDP